MFVSKDQEYTDAHTGVTLAFGEHASAAEDPSERERRAWLRVSVTGQNGEPPKISTIQFRAGEIVRSDKHAASVDQPTPAEQPIETPVETPVEDEEVAYKKKKKY